MLLEVRDLVAGYGELEVIGPVSFGLENGDILVVYGPNGVGKSTLLKTLATILKPLRGVVLLKGERAEKRREEIFFVPENITLPERLKVKDYLHVVSLLYNGGSIDEALKIVGLPGDVRINTLSQGLRRRLQLASVLVAQARVYIVDDPTVGLDDYAAEHLVPSILGEVARRGALIVSTKERRLTEAIGGVQRVRMLNALEYSRVARPSKVAPSEPHHV
uniref:ABC transporter ATP-binding protein n=1 Tax=Thermofilum pendens TaxID=2269 RepID=A0A7C3SPU3_THEPE